MGKLPYFHSYDIRGIASRDLRTENVKNIVKGIISEYNPKTIVIGFDMRVSSKEIFNTACETFNTYGVTVVSIGLASTPQLYFATYAPKIQELNVIWELLLQASHNPKEYNGMKICMQHAKPISYDTGLQDIERRILEEDYELETLQRTTQEVSIQEKYHAYLLHFLSQINDKPKSRPLKVAIDYANAIGCYSNKPILQQLEKDGFIECVHIFDELDGTFPNHEANPLKEETLDVLKEKILQEECDFGLNFDGDSDRIAFVDNRAKYIAPDITGCFLVEHFAKYENNFTTFCYDLRSTQELVNIAKRYSLTCKKTKVGHSNIKHDMNEINSSFACELSGHFYFDQSHSKYDDALRALIEVIVAYSYEKETFNAVMNRYHTTLKSPEINFKVDNVMSKIEESNTWFKEFDLISKDELDGITYEFDEFWINIRASNTEPLLRVNFEVLDKNNKELYDRVIEILKKNLH